MKPNNNIFVTFYKQNKNPMKKTILSLAFAGSLMIATSACNSSKNMAGSSDSTKMDSTMNKPMDTTKSKMPMDTSKSTPPDTTKQMPKM